MLVLTQVGGLSIAGWAGDHTADFQFNVDEFNKNLNKSQCANRHWRNFGKSC
jgi:hypothetical protein